MSAGRPGAGFVVVAASLVVAASFFVWGATTPDLEHAWRLELELETGARPALSKLERRLLQNILVRHPSLAASLIDRSPNGIISRNDDGLVDTGYAYLVRPSAAAPRRLEVSLSGAAEPLEIAAAAGGEQMKAQVAPGAALVWELPNDGPFPQLIEVLAGKKQRKKKKRDEPAALLVRLERAP